MQVDYLKTYGNYISSVKELLAYIHEKEYEVKLVLEPKPFEPRSYILAGTTGQALTIINEVNDPNFGINYDIGHGLIAKENAEEQVALVAKFSKLFHTHFDDNDQQCDADLPPGTVNFMRLVRVLFVLDQINYQGWHGLDLFPFRDEAKKFVKLSRNNLELGYAVVDELKRKNVKELQTSGEKGPEVTQLIIGAMMGGKPYERVRSKYSDEEWELS